MRYLLTNSTCNCMPLAKLSSSSCNSHQIMIVDLPTHYTNTSPHLLLIAVVILITKSFFHTQKHSHEILGIRKRIVFVCPIRTQFYFFRSVEQAASLLSFIIKYICCRSSTEPSNSHPFEVSISLVPCDRNE